MKIRNNLADNIELVQTNDPGALAMPDLTFPTINLIGTLAIPAISASTRQVLTMNLGAIGNPRSILIGFYNSSMVDADIPKSLPSTARTSHGQNLLAPNLATCAAFIPSDVGNCILLISDDYNKTRKFFLGTLSGSSFEKYGVGATALPIGKTYSDIGVGVLIGFYSSTAGLFNLNKGIHMESSWLTQSGANTTLNMALYNTDASTANTTINVKIAIIR